MIKLMLEADNETIYLAAKEIISVKQDTKYNRCKIIMTNSDEYYVKTNINDIITMIKGSNGP